MTVPRLSFDVNVDTALVEFNRLAGRFSNFVPIMGGRLDVAVRRFLRERFESEGRVGGGGQWRKLTPGYASFKAIRAQKSKILQFSGEMARAFTVKGDPHQILRVGVDFYELTVDETIAPRAAGHQKGVEASGLPRRTIVPDTIPKKFIDELKNIVRSYVVRGQT